jgi:hypothetical protein
MDMRTAWLRAELLHPTTKEDGMNNNIDTLIAAASALIIEHAGKRSLWERMRQGISVLGGAAAVTVSSTADPPLLERTRLVVQNGTATIEIFDGRSWAEVWRSTMPEAIPVSDSAAAQAIPSEKPPTQPGQLLWGEDIGWHFAK